MTTEPFRYETAFGRNLGLIDTQEQARLRRATVAIAGLGGVGGGHALTLARLGVGGFRLADPDHFAIANLNRQAGARLSSMGRNKAAVIGEMIRDINPEARVEVLEEGLGPTNVEPFLEGADVVIDGIDFFAIEARRCLFAAARRLGRWALTAGPLGFSAALLAFAPRGMSFDRYFDLTPGMSRNDALIAFAVGLAPRALHLPSMDLSRVDFTAGTGPSSSIACQLTSVLIGTETLAILLDRRPCAAAPAYTQLDPYRGVYHRGVLRFGNRGPLQRLKRLLLRRRLAPQLARAATGITIEETNRP